MVPRRRASWRRAVRHPAAAPVIGLALALGVLAAARPRFPDRPPPAHTGGFGEPTCQECHFEGEPNEPGGTLTLAGVPEAYRPGERYRITITLARSGMRRGGFELAARHASGPLEGRQAGELRPVDARAAVTPYGTPAVTYVHHTAAGTALETPGTARWTIEWTAPTTGGPVIFHVAANAADDDESPFGDFIYTTSARSAREE
ncbi:MAG TPA: choice-of-anchor V domain-containing protein [Longimicrobiales bacterium]